MCMCTCARAHWIQDGGNIVIFKNLASTRFYQNAMIQHVKIYELISDCRRVEKSSEQIE